MHEENKLKHIMHLVCHGLEIVCAVLMVVGIVLAVIGLLRDTELFHGLISGSGEEFMEYIERVLTIVVGIEFLEMLCQPTSENVIEILVILMARHMIVHETTPMQDLVTCVSIAILFILRRWLKASEQSPNGFALPWKKGGEKE